MTEVERYQAPQMERLAPETVKGIANTELIPKELRGNVPAIIATILKGRSIGLDDMSALTAIHFIEGKPTLSAETKVLLARRAGHSITGDFGDGAVTVKGKRGDNGDEMAVTWTKEMAVRAGLADKKNWKTYPEAMLWARAVSQLCRMLFADALLGSSYTPEELELTPEDKVAADIGEVRVPVDNAQPDDSPRREDFSSPNRRPSEDFIEGHVVLDVDDEVVEEVSAGGPEAEQTPDGTLVSSAEEGSLSGSPPEPVSPAEIPATDSAQGASLFADMAERAQETRRRKETGE